MSITPPRTRPSAADELLARDYETLKPEVVATVAGKLAVAGVRLPDADLDAAYNVAWHALHTKLAEGEEVANPTGLLVLIAHRRALDEHRAHHPSRRAEEGALDQLAADGDLDQQLDDVVRLHQFLAGLRERLDRRELEAAALCYLYDYSRPEAARVIGVAPKRMEKIMDGVTRKLAPLLGEIRMGEWCERHRSLVKAYALGLLEEGGERHTLARDHLDDCSACRRGVLQMRGIAAVTPPLPLLLGAAGAIGVGAVGAGAAGAGSASGPGTPAGGGAVASGPRRLLSDPKTKIAGAGVAVIAAVMAALALNGTFDGGEPAAPTAKPPAARADVADAARAAAARRAKARARAEAVAVQRRRAAAERRRARARARARAAASARAAATTSVAPSAAVPQQPEPVAAPQQPATPPPAAPEPAAPEPSGPVRDGAEEFELR